MRAGLYAELGQKIGKWKVLVRGGQSQNDDRVSAVTDMLIVGGTILYKAGPIQLSLEGSQDFYKLGLKTNYFYGAFRIMALL